MRRAAALAATMLLLAAGAIGAGCGDETFGSAGADASDTDVFDGGASDAAFDAPGDAGKSRFCDGVPDASFCADFDRPNADLLEGWTAFDFAAAATTTGDQEDWVSPPLSAALGVGLVVPASTFARLKKTFAGGAVDVQLDLDVNLGDVPDGSVLAPFVIRFGPPNDDQYRFEVGLRVTPTDIEIFELGHTYFTDGAPPTLFGTGFPYRDGGALDGWTHLHVHAVLDLDAGATATFSVGGGPSRSMLLFPQQDMLAPPMTVLVGVAEANLSQAATLNVHVDNVVVNAF